VFEVAADPPSGRRLGIEALVDHIRGRLDEKRVHLGRVIEDARRTARAVAGAAGVSGGGSLDFEKRWEQFRAATVPGLAMRGSTVAAYEEALRSLEQLILRLSAIAGGPFGMRMRQTHPDRLDASRGHRRDGESSLGKGGALGDRPGTARQAADSSTPNAGRIGAPLRDRLGAARRRWWPPGGGRSMARCTSHACDRRPVDRSPSYRRPMALPGRRTAAPPSRLRRRRAR
jgi:hypothetical protein